MQVKLQDDRIVHIAGTWDFVIDLSTAVIDPNSHSETTLSIPIKSKCKSNAYDFLCFNGYGEEGAYTGTNLVHKVALFCTGLLDSLYICPKVFMTISKQGNEEIS